MAQAFKDSYGADVVVWVAGGLAREVPGFDTEDFLAQCLDGFEDLELMARGGRIAAVMAAHLPTDPHVSIPLVAAAMGPEDPSLSGLEPFRYLPHSIFISTHGVPAFEASMAALHALTKRFTAEFGIRPFLVAEPERTLAQLRIWASDPDERVRRLVSEGSRPRLPWARRLPDFVADPTPVLPLLELLSDDESAFVRRSVANHLNDISKDHPELAIEVAARWRAAGGPRREWVVRHGLRTLIKGGDPAALGVLGMAAADHLTIRGSSIEPSILPIGGRIRITVEVADTRTVGTAEQVGVDLLVHFVKANGSTSPKVFKGVVRGLAAGESVRVVRTVSLAVHTTRVPYPGTHRVEAQVNGVRTLIGSFEVTP